MLSPISFRRSIRATSTNGPIAEIRSDPESETLQFVVKAYPLSNDQRLRTIAKRFLTANTELAAAKQQIAHRDSELLALRNQLESSSGATESLREETREVAGQLEAAHARVRELEGAYRALEVDALAKQNAAMERILAAQTDYARGDGAAREAIAQLERDAGAMRAELDAERGRAAQLSDDLKVERVQGTRAASSNPTRCIRRSKT